MRSWKNISCASSLLMVCFCPSARMIIFSVKKSISALVGRSYKSALMSFCRSATKVAYPSEAITVSLFTLWTSSGNTCASMRTPCWSTQRRRPRPTSCRFCEMLLDWRSEQIWNTFGLSHPSRKAEWEKMKRTDSSKLSNLSLFFKIKS